MRVKIELLSNTIFGSGKSIPGGEDIAVLTDRNGFPYLKGATLKGVLKEELENLIAWGYLQGEKHTDITKLFGKAGEFVEPDRLSFTDFTVSDNIKSALIKQGLTKDEITDCFTDTYTFTSIENGIAKAGSLHSCRYINKGMFFYGKIGCTTEQEEIVRVGLKAIKYIGSMRSRGFGCVSVGEV